jgi:hypothetical protein
MQKDRLIKLNIKNAIKTFLDESIAPVEVRLKMARGLAKLETKDLVTMFYYFLFDSDESVKAAAKESIRGLPENLLITYLSFDVPSEILNFFSRLRKDNEKCLEAVVLNKNCATETLTFLAETASENIAQIIADNHEKIIECPEIVDSLERNNNVPVSLIEKLRASSGTLAPVEEAPVQEAPVEEMSVQETPAEETLVQETPVEEEAPDAQEDVSVPPDEEEVKEELKDSEDTQTEELSEEELSHYSEEEIEELKLSTYQRIQSMTVAEKIQEALKGTREARAILIKDTNKLVSSAVVKSPKITENEIVKISASRNIADEVLRIICQKEEWLRNYQIKLNLVYNPKTPFRTAIRFMGFLRKKDLETLAKSKMVPGNIATTARKMAAKKRS